MIFHPKPVPFVIPVETMIEGSITRHLAHEWTVVGHEEDEDGSNHQVLLKRTTDGLTVRIRGDALLPLIKAPPTWYP